MSNHLSDPSLGSPPVSLTYDLEACTALMRGGSKSFFAASRLLPVRVRPPAIALYAFCRLADDAIDEGDDPVLAMADLKSRLSAIYAGRPGAEDADRALTVVVHRYGIPMGLLEALLDGFLWDSQGRVYETLADVEAYGARVAGTVGAMMSLIMGASSETAIARASELGVAMQLTNIARDVGADAALGRIYLPRRWLIEAGVQPEVWLKNPKITAGIKIVVARLLEEADRLYKQAQPGIAALPPDCRSAILAASMIYREIGVQLKRDGLDSVSTRTVVSTTRKLVLLASAWTQAAWIRTAESPPLPLQAIQFLALHNQNTQASAQWAGAYFPNRAMPQRVAWVFDLLERRENERLQGRQRLHS